jgi:phosphoribosyl 1,2-cyclic phosphodiesterase
VKVSVLASGSKGNAALFESRGTRVLVDAGLGPRALAERLAQAGAVGMPHAIVVTHAHADHAGHCGCLARRLGVPVYATRSVARSVDLAERDKTRLFGPREPFCIGSLSFSPFPVPHDVAQIALVVTDGSARVGLATDLGEIPAGLADHLRACDLLLIESNHDRDMLASGPYPEYLKKRVLSARGHLSNDQAGALLSSLPARTHTVALMHISEVNNDPRVALRSARAALGERRVTLVAAEQRTPIVLEATPRRRG